MRISYPSSFYPNVKFDIGQCDVSMSVVDQLWRLIPAAGPGLWPKKRTNEANRVVIESRQLEGLLGNVVVRSFEEFERERRCTCCCRRR